MKKTKETSKYTCGRCNFPCDFTVSVKDADYCPNCLASELETLIATNDKLFKENARLFTETDSTLRLEIEILKAQLEAKNEEKR